MAKKSIQFNNAQLKSVLLNPKHEIQCWGRGTGKSNQHAWKAHRNIKHMPRSSSVITGQTYTQILTRTLPPMMSFLERLGYVRDKDFFIGKRPPKAWGWKLPFEAPMNFDYYIVFGSKKGAVGFHLASQDRVGSGRGLNTDFEFTDESLTLKMDRYNKEIHATNRGNLDRFGHLSFHHGSHHSTSMPLTSDGKWILEAGDYYKEEFNVDYKGLWNRVVKMQLDLLDLTDPYEFKKLWNEIVRVRKRMIPQVSKDGMLFTLANAFDNIENVGLEYIKDQYRTTPRLIFLTEIMNMIIEKVEDCYYNLTDQAIYFDKYNYSYIDSLDYDFKKLGSPDCRFDADLDKDKPIKLVPDWGANISVMLAVQDNHLVHPEQRKTKNFLKEFFVKPESGKVMIDEVIDNFCDYYRFTNDRTVIYYRDKYGDEGLANSSLTYNDQAIRKLRQNGWRVILKEYKGKEPPHHEKFLMWGNILKETNQDKFEIVRINGNNCKFLIIAMNNTKVIDRKGKFEKDKSSEHKKSNIPPEEATHSTDAADKITWIDYQDIKKGGGFIATRL